MSLSDSDTDSTVLSFITPLVDPASSADSCDDEMPPVPVIRYRPPFIQTAKHDARVDAMQLVVDNLVQQDVPQWAARLISLTFVDHFMEQYHTGHVEFQDGVYDPIDASVWCRRVVAEIPGFLAKIVSGEVKVQERPSSYSQWKFSYCAEKNRRKTMEDKHICVPTLEVIGGPNNGAGLFGIFDGHGGVDCAMYASTHLASLFARECEKEDDADNETKLREAMKQLDDRLTLRCQKENWRSGSTAVCVAIDKKTANFAWVGDSAAYVLKSTEVIKVSGDHSPSNPEECRRVEDAGGMMVFIQGEYRVNGVLNLTRALGDIQGRPMIIGDADLSTVALDGSEYLAILACDGVSDQLTRSQIYNTVKKFVDTHRVVEYKCLAASLCAAAREEGSCDNLSVVVVFIRPPADLWKMFAEESNSSDE